MLKHIVGTFLALFLISQAAVAATPLVEQVYSPSVQLRQGNSKGSGTVIYSFGKTYVLTNFHVVSSISTKNDNDTLKTLLFENIDVSSFKYENIDNIDVKSFRGKVVMFNKKMDLALVEVVGAVALPVARLDFNVHPDLGDRVFAIGSGLGHTPFVTEGLLSQTELIDGYPYYHTTSPIIPGNSGGGLYMKCGDDLARFCLIGVPSRVLTLEKGRIPITHMGFAIRLATIAKFLIHSDFEFIINAELTRKIEQADPQDDTADVEDTDDDSGEEESKEG